MIFIVQYILYYDVQLYFITNLIFFVLLLLYYPPDCDKSYISVYIRTALYVLVKGHACYMRYARARVHTEHAHSRCSNAVNR